MDGNDFARVRVLPPRCGAYSWNPVRSNLGRKLRLYCRYTHAWYPGVVTDVKTKDVKGDSTKWEQMQVRYDGAVVPKTIWHRLCDESFEWLSGPVTDHARSAEAKAQRRRPVDRLTALPGFHAGPASAWSSSVPGCSSPVPRSGELEEVVRTKDEVGVEVVDEEEEDDAMSGAGALGDAEAAEMTIMQVTCPDGFTGGMDFTVRAPSGNFDVTIPEGVIPGASFHIRVPTTHSERADLSDGAGGAVGAAGEVAHGARSSLGKRPVEDGPERRVSARYDSGAGPSSSSERIVEVKGEADEGIEAAQQQQQRAREGLAPLQRQASARYETDLEQHEGASASGNESDTLELLPPVGARVRVWCRREDFWRAGCVVAFDGNWHSVLYDNGEEVLENLRREQWQQHDNLQAAAACHAEEMVPVYEEDEDEEAARAVVEEEPEPVGESDDDDDDTGQPESMAAASAPDSPSAQAGAEQPTGTRGAEASSAALPAMPASAAAPSAAPMPAAAGMPAVAAVLERMRLGEYAAGFEEAGYDDLPTCRSCSRWTMTVSRRWRRRSA